MYFYSNRREVDELVEDTKKNIDMNITYDEEINLPLGMMKLKIS